MISLIEPLFIYLSPLFIYLPLDANDAFPCHQPIGLNHDEGVWNGLRPPSHHCFRHATPA